MPTGRYPGESELIVVAKPAAGLRAAPDGTHMTSVARADVTPLNRILERHEAIIRPAFGASEDRLMYERAPAEAPRARKPKRRQYPVFRSTIAWTHPSHGSRRSRESCEKLTPSKPPT